MEGKSMFRGNKGQAALMDLGFFFVLSILALTYLVLESSTKEGEEMLFLERESLYETAVYSLDALLQSGSGDATITTVQASVFKPVNNQLASWARQATSYADSAERILADYETGLRDHTLPTAFLIINDYRLELAIGNIGTLKRLFEDSEEMADLAGNILSQGDSEKEVSCSIASSLGSLLDSYSDVPDDCSSLLSSSAISLLFNEIQGSVSVLSEVEDELKTSVQRLTWAITMPAKKQIEILEDMRCNLKKVSSSANSLLSYLKLGVDKESSFLELWPVELGTEHLPLRDLIAHSMFVGEDFAVTDNTRALSTAMGLMMLRNENISSPLFSNMPDFEGSEMMYGPVYYKTEMIHIIPTHPLRVLTNASALGSFHELLFTAEVYLTQSSRLAVALMVEGDDIGHKRKTNYFEGSDYILDSETYTEREHVRTYNGSAVFGKVVESPVTITESSYNTTETEGNVETFTAERIQEISRPMNAYVNLRIGNMSWAQIPYSFSVTHEVISNIFAYAVDTGTPEPEGAQDDYSSSLLALLMLGRADMRNITEERLEERLDELLSKTGYGYSFIVSDCCGNEMRVEKGSEGKEFGEAKSMLILPDGSHADVILRIWRL
jgi:hypothetical protein